MIQAPARGGTAGLRLILADAGSVTPADAGTRYLDRPIPPAVAGNPGPEAGRAAGTGGPGGPAAATSRPAPSPDPAPGQPRPNPLSPISVVPAEAGIRAVAAGMQGGA